MRKFLFLPLLALLASCGKNEDCDIVTPQPEDLVSPALYATLSQSNRDIPNISHCMYLQEALKDIFGIFLFHS